jgi:hypothetical protein
VFVALFCWCFAQWTSRRSDWRCGSSWQSAERRAVPRWWLDTEARVSNGMRGGCRRWIMQAPVGCGARAVEWDAGTLGHFWDCTTRPHVSVDWVSMEIPQCTATACPPSKPMYLPLAPDEPSAGLPAIANDAHNLAACLGHGAMECTTRREPTGRASGRRHSHCLAAERSAIVVVAAVARVGNGAVLACSCT